MTFTLDDYLPVSVPAGVYLTNYLSIDDLNNENIVRAITTVSSVHGILTQSTDVPTVHVFVGSLTDDTTGQSGYSCDRAVCEIAIQPDAPQFEYVLIHELGHFIDEYLLGDEVRFSNKETPVMEVIRCSERNQVMSRALNRLKTDFDSLKGPDNEKQDYIERLTYLTSNCESFAYAYAQYIAGKSTEQYIKSQYEQVLNPSQHRHLQRAWSPTDFKPIAAAFQALFFDRGWLDHSIGQ